MSLSKYIPVLGAGTIHCNKVHAQNLPAVSSGYVSGHTIATSGALSNASSAWYWTRVGPIVHAGFIIQVDVTGTSPVELLVTPPTFDGDEVFLCHAVASGRVNSPREYIDTGIDFADEDFEIFFTPTGDNKYWFSGSMTGWIL